MPIYEYRCRECGDFEKWLTMQETGLSVECPTCDEQAERVFSAPGLMIMSHNIRKRIEYGAEPKVMSKQELDMKPHYHRHSHKKEPSRPWQIGH
ncbi:Zinc ribbon domain protein [compost metagenome]|jgi:putative FmdB family regulatory protein